MRKNILFMILCFVLQIALAGCGISADNNRSTENTLQVDIDIDKVSRIDLYWAYRQYTVQREDSSFLIDNAIELLNGDYAAYARWVNNGTGSGNHMDLYDLEGNILKTYFIFMSEDGLFTIWEEGTEHISYQRETSQDNLQEIVKMVAVEQYLVEAP